VPEQVDELSEWRKWRFRTRVPAPAVGESAQGVYKAMLKERVSPAMRDLGA